MDGYYSSGAESESTLRNNRAAYAKWRLVPRCMVDVSQVDMTCTLLGAQPCMQCTAWCGQHTALFGGALRKRVRAGTVCVAHVPQHATACALAELAPCRAQAVVPIPDRPHGAAVPGTPSGRNCDCVSSSCLRRWHGMPVMLQSGVHVCSVGSPRIHKRLVHTTAIQGARRMR